MNRFCSLKFIFQDGFITVVILNNFFTIIKVKPVLNLIYDGIGKKDL